MALFSRHSPEEADLRDRDYVLTGCPLVAQDDQVVLVDLTVRLAVREALDGRSSSWATTRPRRPPCTRSACWRFACWPRRCRPTSC